jgi:hypothetical protein
LGKASSFAPLTRPVTIAQEPDARFPSAAIKHAVSHCFPLGSFQEFYASFLSCTFTSNSGDAVIRGIALKRVSSKLSALVRLENVTFVNNTVPHHDLVAVNVHPSATPAFYSSTEQDVWNVEEAGPNSATEPLTAVLADRSILQGDDPFLAEFRRVRV